MKEFNIYTMRGASAEDNKVLNEYINNDLEDTLECDEYGRVFNALGGYIADYIETDAGDGIGC